MKIDPFNIINYFLLQIEGNSSRSTWNLQTCTNRT